MSLASSTNGTIFSWTGPSGFTSGSASTQITDVVNLNGGTYRPSHVHFKITASSHKELVTQLYFEGDPYINADPWASDDDAEERIIALNEDGNGNKSGIFDIKMMPS